MKQNAIKGFISLSMAFLLVIAGVVGYSLYKVIPFYYSYYELVALMDAQAKQASLVDSAQMRKTILKRIKELEIPLNNADDLKIERVGEGIVIELSYVEVFDIEWRSYYYEIYPFEFTARVEKVVGRENR